MFIEVARSWSSHTAVPLLSVNRPLVHYLWDTCSSLVWMCWSLECLCCLRWLVLSSLFSFGSFCAVNCASISFLVLKSNVFKHHQCCYIGNVLCSFSILLVEVISLWKEPKLANNWNEWAILSSKYTFSLSLSHSKWKWNL